MTIDEAIKNADMIAETGLAVFDIIVNDLQSLCAMCADALRLAKKMSEENDECREVFEVLTRQDGFLWDCVKGNRGYSERLIKEIREVAEMLACEAIQVAAMAQKYLDTEEQNE